MTRCGVTVCVYAHLNVFNTGLQLLYCHPQLSSEAGGVLLTDHLNLGLPHLPLELQVTKFGLHVSPPLPEAPKALAEGAVQEKLVMKTPVRPNPNNR